MLKIVTVQPAGHGVYYSRYAAISRFQRTDTHCRTDSGPGRADGASHLGHLPDATQLHHPHRCAAAAGRSTQPGCRIGQSRWQVRRSNPLLLSRLGRNARSFVDTGIRIRLFAAGAPGPRTRGPRKYGHGHIVAPLRRMDIVYVEVPAEPTSQSLRRRSRRCWSSSRARRKAPPSSARVTARISTAEDRKGPVLPGVERAPHWGPSFSHPVSSHIPFHTIHSPRARTERGASVPRAPVGGLLPADGPSAAAFARW